MNLSQQPLLSWPRVKAALIRAFWAVIFPGVGYMLNLAINALQGADLMAMGWQGAAIVAGVSGLLYGLKREFWPDTTF